MTHDADDIRRSAASSPPARWPVNVWCRRRSQPTTASVAWPLWPLFHVTLPTNRVVSARNSATSLIRLAEAQDCPPAEMSKGWACLNV